MKIAFVHNLKTANIEEQAEFDSKETVVAISTALTKLGHSITPIDACAPIAHVIAQLDAAAPDLVFNTAEGKKGALREALFPSLFEEMQLPYTGSNAHVCAVTLDKHLTKTILQREGIAMPPWLFVKHLDDLAKCNIPFPVIVKPNFEGSSRGIHGDAVVHTSDALYQKVGSLLAAHNDGILVEQFIDGIDVVVPYLAGVGNGVLSPCAYTFCESNDRARSFAIYDYSLKNQLSDYVHVKLVADLTPQQQAYVKALSSRIFSLLNIVDVARIDFRLSPQGEFYFLEINALPSLEPGASLYISAAAAGLPSMEMVLEKIVQSAVKRFAIKPGKKLKPDPLIGVLYNLKRVVPLHNGENDSEAEFDSEATINAIVDALKSFGHRCIKMEATQELPARLQHSKPDIVFNIAEGIHGRNREAQVPALLELLGIEYTGSDAATMSVTLDKIMAKTIIKEAGILTPEFTHMITGKEKVPPSLKYPLIIKPVAEGSSKGIFDSSVVLNETQLRAEVVAQIGKYKQPVLVEQYIDGREFTVGILGSKKLKILPIMEIVFLDDKKQFPVYSFEYKLNYKNHVRYDIPAVLSASVQAKIERIAKRCFDVLWCRDVARIDFRMTNNGDIYFLECNPLPGLVPEWSDLCLMAKVANLDHRGLIGEIVAPAIRRWREHKRGLHKPVSMDAIDEQSRKTESKRTWDYDRAL